MIHSIFDVLPPKIKLEYFENGLKITGNEKLTENEHTFYFKAIRGFKKITGGFYKETDELEGIIKNTINYLDEKKFEYFGDDVCQKIIDRVKKRGSDFKQAREIGEGIKSNEPVAIEVPNFSKDRPLKVYQVLPVQHMIQVPNVANFSIPGSGKTTMAYAAYSYLKNSSKVDQLFVVGPLSSFKPWEDEFKSCFGKPPENNVLRFSGTLSERKKLLSDLKDYEVILTGYQTATNDEDDLTANLFPNRKIMMVIDESHHVKSFDENASWSNAMIRLGRHAMKRVILTGTPLPHGWKDLWSQITFLYPDLRVLDSRFNYKDTIVRPDVESTVSESIRFLWTRISHNDMKKDLPKINTIPLPVKMSPLQEEIYNALEGELAILENQSDLDFYELQELRRVKMLRLLQCVTNPAAIRKADIEFDLEPYEIDNRSIMDKLENYKEVPKKIFEAVTLATQLAKQKKNVVIWVVFRHNVRYICELLEEMDPIPISGEIPIQTNEQKQEIGRDDLIDLFKNSKGKIMVATMGSLAESVSLHRNQKGEPVCQNAIYLERSFNAGQFMQSIFRIYRIGSDPKTPVTNTYFTSVYSDGYTRTIDDVVFDRLKERSDRMFRLMNDPTRLIPIDLDAEDYKIGGKAQIFDENEQGDLVRRKILDMIKRHQQKNKL